MHVRDMKDQTLPERPVDRYIAIGEAQAAANKEQMKKFMAGKGPEPRGDTLMRNYREAKASKRNAEMDEYFAKKGVRPTYKDDKTGKKEATLIGGGS